MSLYEKLGVARVINASGRMTALGGAVLTEAVLRSMHEAGQSYVDVEDLKRAAGLTIAEMCGSEDAMVTSGAAAGVVTMVAAMVAGTNADRVLALPNADWDRRDIAIQAGHLVHFGGDTGQMIRIGGGVVRAVGAVNLVTREALRTAIGPRTAAVLFVQSHHAVQRGMLGLPEVIATAHACDIPVLVDAAAEEALSRYIQAGADLVAYSGGKAFEGPTSGFVAGRAALVAACRAQESGVARPMKIGKEAIAGLLQALEDYGMRDDDHRRLVWRGYVEQLMEGLSKVEGLDVGTEADEAGREIWRVVVRVRPGADPSLEELVAALRAGSPSIRVRDHHLAEGRILLDPRPLLADDLRIIVARMGEVMAGRWHPGTETRVD